MNSRNRFRRFSCVVRAATIGISLVLAQPLLEGCKMADDKKGERVPVRISTDARRYQFAIGKMPPYARDKKDPNREAKRYMLFDTSPGGKAIKGPALRLAEACAELGISQQDFLNMQLSFEDPYRKREFKIPIRRGLDSVVKRRAFGNLRAALREGIGAINSTYRTEHESNWGVTLDRLVLRGNEIDFAYSFHELKARAKVPR